MIDPTEEQLMAFADGELDAETQRWIASVLAERPDLARKVAAYRETGRRLGDVIGKGMPLSDDRALADKIMAHPLPGRKSTAGPQRARNGSGKPLDAEPPRSGGTVVQFPGRGSAKRTRRPTAPNLALAAGIAALVTGALTMTLIDWRASERTAGVQSASPTTVTGKTSGSSATGEASALAAPALSTALETTPSARNMTVAGNWTIEPVLTFEARDGRYCREYRARHASGSAVAGVACRTASGWERIAEAPASLPPANATDGTRPVEIRRAPPPTVDSAIRGLGGKDALDAAPEADLMARSWK